MRERGASNNFVVAGSRSATGKPLLANDPHLGLQSPIQWYLVRLETPTLTLVGATAPGVPMLIIGHNGQVAWSFVTTSSDTQDLFLEKLLPGDPTHYLAPAGPLAFETRNEIIKVEGADDIALTARRSRHGPILSDAPSLEWTDPTQVLSLAWPGLDEDDGTAAALYRINRARNARGTAGRGRRLRQPDAEHPVCRYPGPYRLHRARPHAPAQEAQRRRADAGAGLDGRL